jgi:hypothetical protein
MKKAGCRNRGSITVEASIIVPFIILSIAALVYIGLVLYQQAQIRSAADMAVEAGAAAWNGAEADTGTGRMEMSDAGDGSLYWRLADSGRDEKLGKIARYAEKALEKGKLLNAASSRIEVNIRDYVLYKKLEVAVANTYELPFGSLLRVFGGSGRFSIDIKSESVLDDPVELIRNVDFAVDMEKELEDRFPELKDLREKAKDVLSGVKGKINEFLD